MENHPTGAFFIPKNKKMKVLATAATFFLKKKNDLLLTLDAQENFKPGKQHPKYITFEQGTFHGQALASDAGKVTLFNFLTGSLDEPT